MPPDLSGTLSIYPELSSQSVPTRPLDTTGSETKIPRVNQDATPPSATRGTKARNNSVWLKVFVGTASTLLTLLLLEGALRWLRLSPAIIEIGVSVKDSRFQRSANPILQYELRPGTGDVNAQGLIGTVKAVKKPPGTRRILLLGDSVLEPFNKAQKELLNSQLETLCNQTGFMFQGQPVKPGSTEVLNLGVGGYNTLMEVEALRVKGLPFEPDVVIVVFVENDFEDIMPPSAVLAAIPRPAWAKWAFRKSHLFRWLSIKLDWWGFRSDADPVATAWSALGKSTNNVARALPLLKEMSVKHRFEPLIAIWPHFSENSVSNANALPDRQTLVVEALAGMAGIPTFRLSDYFESYFKSRGSAGKPRVDLTFNGDGVHPNAEGARIAALALKAILDIPNRQTATDPSVWRAKADATLRMTQMYGSQANTIFDYPTALLAFGQELELYSGTASEAIGYYQATLKIVPNSFDAHFRLGRVYRKMGERGRALAYFQRALALKPEDAETRKQIQELSAPTPNVK